MVMFVLVVLDGTVVAVACTVVVFVFGFFLLGSSSVDCDCGAAHAVGVNFVVVFIGVVCSVVVFGACVVGVGGLYFHASLAYFLVLTAVITGAVYCTVRAVGVIVVVS